VGVPLRGVPEADEEGDDAEVEEAATVLVCRGLGAALRWDLEGEKRRCELGVFQERTGTGRGFCRRGQDVNEPFPQI
jgi:hypothetical protein